MSPDVDDISRFKGELLLEPGLNSGTYPFIEMEILAISNDI